ncbi:zinc-dependent peptidase [Roseibium sp. RKSG952]|uniref:M90 family metallopeptidase n=1 Tax=Roseibium sp. RKSG952 TaxID=2529384 RepID=UPI0012BC57B9|nr:M90 family metallopeptidase [Roseibium sp. RKSG952]MTI03785.1 zinc-dependent peptidase [Roseibium sp. RKSG952]
MLIFFAILLLVAGGVGYYFWSRKQARATLLATPLSEHQRAVIEAMVPIVKRLPPDLRDRLQGKVNLFLDQVDFIGCDDLEVTEEMQLSIAAQACILVVNSDMWYDNLTTILIYPNAFKSQQRRHSGYVVTEQEIVRTGESWDRGPVILSWAHSRQGARDDHDGHNVVFHEFAHQIDDLSGGTNGVPLLAEGQTFAEWERVFLTAFEAHVHAVESGRRTVIDPYGAEGHEEFFAVSVEVFFERPQALKHENPEVYEQLSKLFRLDPVAWV